MTDRIEYEPANRKEKFGLLTEQWQPRVVAELNDYQFKVARLEGDFIWHDHPETDEAFLVIEGRLRIERPCWRPQAVVLTRNDESTERFPLPFEGNGFNYEAAEVMRLLRAGEKESEIMPLDESVDIMETLDAIRAQWGLRYPME